jgi:rhodanese-related sulfurtransferase
VRAERGRLAFGEEIEPIGRLDLIALARGDAILPDVRPAHESPAGDIDGVPSIPIDELDGGSRNRPTTAS